MRRRLVQLVAFLLLGAVVNVAVAWGFACLPSARQFHQAPADYVRTQFADRSLLDGMTFEQPGTRYVAIAYMRGGYTPRADRDDIAGFIRRQFGYVRRSIQRWFATNEKPPSSYFAVVARGWSVPSLYSTEEIDDRLEQTGTRLGYVDRGAVVFSASSRGNTGYAPFYAVALPCYPICPGFAINTVFYAAIFWLLFAAPGKLRRRRRIKRGLCPVCAYPVGSSDVCTECGKPVTPRHIVQ